ncbi:hypothetical protein L195_g033098 [Trifolium pratense]|uniref:Uncharacterized protein n=1 Tax=Trifolium pratense TaxID=57577 RepID=A0A2K3LF35_TRIPR|nr:hypothetical protein L195_g033098 [Trifolium pratense]
MKKSWKMMLILLFVVIATIFGEVVYGARTLKGDDPPVCYPQPEACILNPKCCPGSVILWLLPFDDSEDMQEPSILSDEVCGPSEIGDLKDSLCGCLVSEALIDHRMHFDCPADDSSYQAF